MTSRLSLARSLTALWCLVAVGCAELTHEPTNDAARGVVPRAEPITSPAAEEAAIPEAAASSVSAAALAASTQNSIDAQPPASQPSATPPSISTAEGSQRESAPPSIAPASQGSGPVPVLSPSEVASPTTADAVDLASLVTRLRKTHAIGLLTKLAVKYESDNLLAKFRAYHTQHGTATLDDLRRSYDLLFGRLHSLLQENDPALARDIDRSRAAIWEILADPTKFSASRLIAGT